LEKEERSSVIVLAPTVMTSATRAGELLTASTFEFPAATMRWRPEATSYIYARTWKSNVRNRIKGRGTISLVTHVPRGGIQSGVGAASEGHGDNRGSPRGLGPREGIVHAADTI
jgi:hypothetical protein